MSTALIFEDSEYSPISMLLRNSINGSDIFFSGSDLKLLGLALEKMEIYDNVIVFVDVVPNNETLVTLYSSLVSALRETNCIVVPIFCIEYIALQMLRRYSYVNDVDSILRLSLDDLSVKLVIDTYDNASDDASKSVEKFYKWVLGYVTPICMKNSFKYNVSKDGVRRIKNGSSRGIFYNSDCSCRRCKRDSVGFERDLIFVKANRLYIELPVFDIRDNEQKVLFESISNRVIEDSNIRDLFISIKSLYKKLSKTNGYPELDVLFTDDYDKDYL